MSGRTVSYVRLDPTGNVTCLVTGEVPGADRPAVTSRLMDRCEQVGYLVRPGDPSARARLEMMGGEFCGNAAMAAAAWLAQSDGAVGRAEIPLEVSGAEGVLSCRAEPMGDGLFEGTVVMPPVTGIFSKRVHGFDLVAVRMEGIAHLILENRPLERERAEALLLAAAEDMPDKAVGLLLWDGAARFMRPLVFVRESGTLVWETGCGSGSTAVGAWLARRRGDGVTRCDIRQPGGVIRAEAEARRNRVTAVRITGRVTVGRPEELIL